MGRRELFFHAILHNEIIFKIRQIWGNMNSSYANGGQVKKGYTIYFFLSG